MEPDAARARGPPSPCPRLRLQAIAMRLGISARTVESHVGAVLRKLQLSSRHEVSHWAAARGLIDPTEPEPRDAP